MQKIRLFTLTLFLILVNQFGCTQTKIEYSIKSNILNPDTLKGDQKLVFNHFLRWIYKEVFEAKPFSIKDEFNKIGITTEDNDRFREAYYFFRLEMTAHKKSIENWEEFKKLAPTEKKSNKNSK